MKTFKELEKGYETLVEEIYDYFTKKVNDFCDDTGFGYDCGMGCICIKFTKDSINEHPHFNDMDITDAVFRRGTYNEGSRSTPLIKRDEEWYTTRLREMEESNAKEWEYHVGYDGEITDEEVQHFEDTKKRLKMGIEVVEKFYPILKEAEILGDCISDKYILAGLNIDREPTTK